MARQEIQTATALRRSPQEDRRSRMVKYSIAMGVRMVCIVLVFVFPAIWWVFGIGAVVLPYVAVVVANVGSSGSSEPARPAAAALAQLEPPSP